MLVHVTWQQSGDEAALRPELEVPDELDNDDVAGYLEEQHGGTVNEWKPLTRRADPTDPKPLACPHCGSDQFAEIGYVDYRSRGEISVDTDGTTFCADGDTRFGEDYHPIAFECADCDASGQSLAGEPFERPDPDALRVRLARERQQLAEEEQQHPSRDDLDYANADGMLPNLEALGSVEAFDAGVEGGIELATGAALRAICGTRAYIARKDWRLRLLNFARTELEEPGARLITLRAGGKIDVASRLYPETAYKNTQQMMDVACTRQTRVQNESEANVYVARRHRDGVVIFTYRHGVLIDDGDSAPATAIPPLAPGT
jgi:hypothetical protein